MTMKLIAVLGLISCVLCSPNLQPPTPHGNASNGYRAVAYYTNWAIYERQFFPRQLPVSKLTHVLYAFANINPDTGEVYLSDPWADTEILLAGSVNSTGKSLHGCLEQLYFLKKQNRNLKILLSIGGAEYSTNFAQPASTPSGRSKFASSVVSLIQDLGIDGIDINWENVASDMQADHLVQLIQAVRTALDAYSTSLSTHYKFTLTVACPAGPLYYKILHLQEMTELVDFWNLMAYDYSGPWSIQTSHQANIFCVDDNSTPFSTQSAVEYYLSQGIPASKIVLGMPVYGRAFDHSNGIGTPFRGVGKGTWEAGIYDFKALPLPGASETFDNKSGASYSYDSIKRELISYDNIEAARRKAAWIQQLGLGGGMWWEASADGQGNNSLIQNVVDILRADGLQNSSNLLHYPNSTYSNIYTDSVVASTITHSNLSANPTLATTQGLVTVGGDTLSLTPSGTLEVIEYEIGYVQPTSCTTIGGRETCAFTTFYSMTGNTSTLL